MGIVRESWRCVVNAGSTLGEGALWDVGDQVFYWVDIERAQVHRYDPIAREDRFVTVPSRCGTVVRRQSGGLVVALEDQVAAIIPDWSAATVTKVGGDAPRVTNSAASTGPLPVSLTPTDKLCSLEADKPGNRANDGKCDPAGRLWVGTMGSDAGAGSLYRVDRDATCIHIFGDVTTSNGICWTSNGATMYYIDTRTHRVDAFDFDLASGAATGRRTHIEVPHDVGAPDGMTIDANDDLWVALWGGGAVSHWSGKSGELIDLYEIPAQLVTSCSFGGSDLATLYVTTARIGLSDAESAKQPLAGGVFTLSPGVVGVPMVQYCG